MTTTAPRVLIVDDDTDLRRCMALWLAESGFAASEAENGRQALDMVRSERPQAVLLDLAMPVLDGFGFLRELPSLVTDPPPVIVVSGKGRVSDVVAAFKLGAADYLLKPLDDFELLIHAVARATDEAALRRKVRQAESRYFNLVQNLPLLVYEIDPSLTLTFVNKSCRRLFGVRRRDILGRPGWIVDRAAPEDRQALTALLTASLAGTDGLATRQCRFRHESGQTTHALITAMPSTRCAADPEAGPSAEGIIVDITERVELERFAVQEERLKVLGAISAELAHEIKNPLFAIAGYARRLFERLPEAREARIVLDEAARLEKILDRVGNYLRPVAMRPRPCSLGTIAAEAAAFLAPEMAAREVSARLDLAPDLPDIVEDPELLAQSAVTLLRHAAGHARPGTAILVRTAEDERGARLEVGYAAAAPANPASGPELLFLPFEEGQDNAGLPLCHRVIKNMGGGLTFSLEGDEALFTVILPREPAGAAT